MRNIAGSTCGEDHQTQTPHTGSVRPTFEYGIQAMGNRVRSLFNRLQSQASHIITGALKSNEL